jgi:hypothetical protein
MKKIFILLILILTPCFTYGKDTLLINQPWDGFPGWNAETVNIDSVSQLPTKIQFIVNYWIKKSMTDFANNVKLVRGQIMDIESLFANDSIPQTEQQGIIPKYQLFYELSDSSLNIGAYGFEVTFDQYGQVLYFGWPIDDYNIREKFIKPQSVLDLAIKHCKKKKYKTNKRSYELKFDPKLNKMCWYISFIQKSSGNEFDGYKEFITIVIDATELKILDEFEDGLGWATDFD